MHAASAPEASRVALELLRLALSSGRYDEQLAETLRQINPALDGEALWEGVAAEIERQLAPDAVDHAISMLVALQTNPPTSMPANVEQAQQELLRRAYEVRATADAAAVNAALQQLRADPGNEQQRQTIVDLGPRAVPAVRDALREALQAAPPEATYVQELHDLLKTLLPDWPGFSADAPVEAKLKSLQELASG